MLLRRTKTRNASIYGKPYLFTIAWKGISHPQEWVAGMPDCGKRRGRTNGGRSKTGALGLAGRSSRYEACGPVLTLLLRELGVYFAEHHVRCGEPVQPDPRLARRTAEQRAPRVVHLVAPIHVQRALYQLARLQRARVEAPLRACAVALRIFGQP